MSCTVWLTWAAVEIKMENRIGGKYSIGKKIGRGSFGEIYLGTHITSGAKVAIKLEPRSARHQ